jgi:hypothetical protein
MNERKPSSCSTRGRRLAGPVQDGARSAARAARGPAPDRGRRSAGAASIATAEPRERRWRFGNVRGQVVTQPRLRKPGRHNAQPDRARRRASNSRRGRRSRLRGISGRARRLEARGDRDPGSPREAARERAGFHAARHLPRPLASRTLIAAVISAQRELPDTSSAPAGRYGSRSSTSRPSASCSPTSYRNRPAPVRASSGDVGLTLTPSISLPSPGGEAA